MIGLISSRMDPEFVEIILGESYVEMTKENIASGDPMAVYKEKGRFDMSFAITLNNLWVSFLTFILGAVYGLGTIFVLIRNGIMVGAFQYFFIERGLFWESFLTIWIHGTLEISAIIIAGAAGLTMGRGLAFPGTYSRLRSFQISAKRGLKILIGIAPIIITAGFIEGFLTRQTDTPDILRFAFILACLAFVIFYFIIFPRITARKASSKKNRKHPHLMPDQKAVIDFSEIKTSGQIFAETFMLFRDYWRVVFWSGLGLSIVYTLSVFALSDQAASILFYFPDTFMGTMSEVNDFFINKSIWYLPYLNILLLSLFFTILARVLIKIYEPEILSSNFFLDWFKALPGMSVIILLLWTNDFYTIFLILFLGAWPLLWAYTAIVERISTLRALERSIRLMGASYGKSLSVMLVFMLIGFLFFNVLDSALFSVYLDMLSWLTNWEGDQLQNNSIILQVGTTMLVVFFILSVFFIGVGMLYHSLVEILEAPGLMKKIDEIGQSTRIRGLERESEIKIKT